MNRIGIVQADRLRSAGRRMGIGSLVALALMSALNCGAEGAVLPPPGAPNIDLRIQKSANFSNRNPGEQVTFTVTVSNLGPISATGVYAGDTLPTGLTYVRHIVSAGTYNVGSGLWTIGTLAVDATAVLTLTVSVNAGTAGSTLINRAGTLSSEMNDTVTTNNLAQAAVTVTAVPPPPAGVFFSSNWSTATGNTNSALTDGGKWTHVYCQTAADVVDVVPGAPLGWTRTPNVIRFRQLGPICGGIEVQNVVPASTSHWGRTYFRNDETTGINQHALTYSLLGPVQVTIWGRQGSGSGVRAFMRTYFVNNGTPSQWPNDAWYPTTSLQNGVWYRFEWHMEYVTATTYRIWPRLYDMSGTLLYDATTYFHNNTPAAPGGTLAAWYAAGNTYGLSNLALARHLGLTMEGQPAAVNTGLAWYHADLALSTAGWIGQ